MNGAAQALKNGAEWTGKVMKNAKNLAETDWTWADNAALDWEGDFMSEETRRDKELLDLAAEGANQALEFIEANLPELEGDVKLLIP